MLPINLPLSSKYLCFRCSSPYISEAHTNTHFFIYQYSLGIMMQSMCVCSYWDHPRLNSYCFVKRRFSGDLSESRSGKTDLNFASDLCSYLTSAHGRLIETSNSLKLTLCYSPSIPNQLLLQSFQALGNT